MFIPYPDIFAIPDPGSATLLKKITGSDPQETRRNRSSPAHLIRGGDVAVLDAVGGGDSVGRVPGGG